MSSQSTTQLVLITDHPERMLINSFSQDRCKPKFKALLQAIGEGVQLQEEQFFDLLLSRGLDEAIANSLVQWGRIVGEQQGGLNDDDYRRFIKARIAANISEGTIDELIGVFATVTSPSSIRYFEHFPAGFRLTAFRADLLSDSMRRRINRLMKSIKPGGVGMSLTEALTDSILFSTATRGFGSTFSRVI